MGQAVHHRMSFFDIQRIHADQSLAEEGEDLQAAVYRLTGYRCEGRRFSIAHIAFICLDLDDDADGVRDLGEGHIEWF